MVEAGGASTEGSTDCLSIGLLGSTELSVAGSAVRLGGQKPRAILAMLALNADRPVSIEQLIDGVWGEQPPTGVRASLQVHVSGLRRALQGSGQTSLVSERPGYRLRVARSAVDVYRFKDAAVRARESLLRGLASDAAGVARAALVTWRGPPLSDLVGVPFAEPVAVGLNEERIALVEVALDADLALGLHADVVPELEELVVQNPFREGLWVRMMLALYRSGRQRDALAACTRLRVLLRDELGLSPAAEVVAIERAILQQDPALLGPSVSLTTTSSLPFPTTTLVGRKSELANLDDLLRNSEVRLATLTGPGGVGKTRLAVEAARSVSASGRAVCFVDLAPSAGLTTIAPALSRALASDASTINQVATILGRRSDLLVLDNCESVSGVGSEVAFVLARCPTVSVLATSRVALGINGENRMPVAPLPMPDAIELFTDRARAVSGSSYENQCEAVARICQQVDALPLGIEFAAARSRLIPIKDLDIHLRGSVLSLTGPADTPTRQRTLGDTLRWSVDLLSPAARLLLARLGVFEAGFTLDAADAVMPETTTAAIVGLLAELVDASLIIPPVGAESPTSGLTPRFRLLETVRSFANEELSSTGQSEATLYQHAMFFARRFRDIAEQDALGRHVAEVDRELPNLTRAINHLMTVEPASAAELVVGVGMSMYLLGQGSVVSVWVDRSLKAELSGPIRSGALILRGVLSYYRNEDSALSKLDEGVRLALEHNVVSGLLSLGLSYAAAAAIEAGDVDGARGRVSRARQVATQTGRERPLSLALDVSSYVARLSGNTEEARDWSRQAVESARRLRDDVIIAQRLCSYAQVLAVDGDPLAALAVAQESVELASCSKSRIGVADAHAALGHALVSAGRQVEALSHLSFAIDEMSELSGFEQTDACWLAAALAPVGNPRVTATLWGALAASTQTGGDHLYPQAATERALLEQLDPCEFEDCMRAGAAIGVDGALRAALQEARRIAPALPSEQR